MQSRAVTPTLVAPEDYPDPGGNNPGGNPPAEGEQFEWDTEFTPSGTPDRWQTGWAQVTLRFGTGGQGDTVLGASKPFTIAPQGPAPPN